ncbi:MAG: hypothetical protein E6J90_51330, partial [Deltaproteobacteria bacterium]
MRGERHHVAGQRAQESRLRRGMEVHMERERQRIAGIGHHEPRMEREPRALRHGLERGDEPRDARLDAADVVSREPVTEQAEERGLGLWIERVPARGGSADGLTAQLDGSAGTHHRIRSVRRLDPRLSTGDHGWRHLDGWPIGAGVVDARLLADRHRPALARVRRPSLPPIAIAGSTSAACHLCPTSCTARTVAAAPTLAQASRLPENTAPPRGVRRARWPAISNAMPTQIAITSIARRWSG